MEKIKHVYKMKQTHQSIHKRNRDEGIHLFAEGAGHGGALDGLLEVEVEVYSAVVGHFRRRGFSVLHGLLLHRDVVFDHVHIFSLRKSYWVVL